MSPPIYTIGEKKPEKKFRASTGFEPVTSANTGATVSLCNVLDRVSVESHKQGMLQNRVFCFKRILYSSAPTPTSPEGGGGAGYLLVGARESILFLAFAQVSSRTRLPSSLSLASHRLQGNKYFSSLDSLMISTLSRNQFALRNLLSCQMRTLVSSPGERIS